MSARVVPMPTGSRIDVFLARLAECEADYLAAKNAHADALTLLGLALVDGTWAARHQHAVEARAQELHQAEMERNAAVALLLREWAR